MTASEAKRDLPNVTVRLPNGEVYPARVSGRLNKFATVTISYIHQTRRRSLRSFGAPWIDYQYSWDAVAKSATDGTPLTT